jgi:hypothetical protein
MNSDSLDIEILSGYYEYDETISRIQSFKTLSHGWDYGDGDPINTRVINRAISIYIRVISAATGELMTSASPTSNGGIILTFSYQDQFIDVILKRNLTIDLRHEVGVGEDYEVEYEQSNAKFIDLINLLSNLCSWSEPYTYKSITSTNDD